MSAKRDAQSVLAEDIIGRIARRHSTATVLLHHAVAERLGLGPTDLKCLDVMRERGTTTGSELAEITGLTSGAITGVVARLEQAGFLDREADPHDGRKQNLGAAPERMGEIHATFAPMRQNLALLLKRFDAQQLKAIAEFLDLAADLMHNQVALMRALDSATRTGLLASVAHRPNATQAPSQRKRKAVKSRAKR